MKAPGRPRSTAFRLDIGQRHPIKFIGNYPTDLTAGETPKEIELEIAHVLFPTLFVTRKSRLTSSTPGLASLSLIRVICGCN